MRMRLLALSSIFMLVLFNISNASTPIPTVCQPGYNWNGLSISNNSSAIGLSLLALTISFDVVAIAFALSRLFPSLGIRNWLQNEYWEIAKTALIIVVIFGVIAIVANLSHLLVPNLVKSGISASGSGAVDLTPLIAGAEGYLCGVNTNLISAWDEMGIMGAGTGFWSTVQVGFYIPIPIGPYATIFDGVYFLPFSNWALQTGNHFISWYGSIINDLINFILFPFTSITIGLITTLPSLAFVGLTFFIPLGLTFRAFPFVRGIGGTLIAIGLALCVVLPSVLILFNYEATSLLASALPIIQPPPQTVSLSCSIPTLIGGIICAAIGLPLSALNSATGFVQDVWWALPIFSTTAIYTYMNEIMQYGIYLIIQLLLFSFDLILMYPIVDNVARSLGGSIRLSLGGKLRLAS